MTGEKNATELRMRWVQVPTTDGGFRAEMRWIPVPTEAVPLPVAQAALRKPEAAA